MAIPTTPVDEGMRYGYSEGFFITCVCGLALEAKELEDKKKRKVCIM